LSNHLNIEKNELLFTLGVGIIKGDMTGEETAAAATNELKFKGLTLFVELLEEEDDEDDDDDGGVQF
jgi:hypothetical protein